jgi:FMN phosphatase YigB (HAD superfamily)
VVGLILLGDNPASDIAPPASLGMITVWARAAAKLQLEDQEPDHVIESFADLRRLLRESYGLSLAR